MAQEELSKYALKARYLDVRKLLNNLESYAHGLYFNFHDTLFLKNGKINKAAVKRFSDEIVSIAKEGNDFEHEESYTYFREAIDIIMTYFEFAKVETDQTYLGMEKVFHYIGKYSIKESYKTTFEVFIEDLKGDESIDKRTIDIFESKLSNLFKLEESFKKYKNFEDLDLVNSFRYYLKQYCINHGYSIINNDSDYKKFERMINENEKWITRYSILERRRRETNNLQEAKKQAIKDGDTND